MLTHGGVVAPYRGIDIGSSLAQVFACRLATLDHYRNQCCRIANETPRNASAWSWDKYQHFGIDRIQIASFTHENHTLWTTHTGRQMEVYLIWIQSESNVCRWLRKHTTYIHTCTYIYGVYPLGDRLRREMFKILMGVCKKTPFFVLWIA